MSSKGLFSDKEFEVAEIAMDVLGSGTPLKYYGAHGTLRGHAPGLYIVEATSLENARRRLHPSVYLAPSRPRPWHLIEGLQEIKGEWAEVLSDTLDQIRNREEEYYTDLGNEVFFVEV